MTESMEVLDGWSEGRLQLIVGMCEKMGVKDIFNKHLEKDTGRPPDIPAGIEAEVMLAGMCIEEGYRPLYQIKEFYKYKDLEGIFHHPIKLSQLNDDRFGPFLDDFYDAGCRKIFQEVSARAFAEYGIKIGNINYDTTSKVMWGEYESADPNEKVSYITIDFGHSKDKRGDKKQIKLGVGTTNGVIVDAKALSGNKDDKTYNKENMEDVDQLLNNMNVDRDDFYYIADSALFTKGNIEKAEEHNIRFITRVPDNTNMVKDLLKAPLPKDAQTVMLENAQNNTVKYRLMEVEKTYQGHDCKLAVLYSHTLENTKRETCQRRAKKERKSLDKSIKEVEKRVFSCREDAEKEIESLVKKHRKSAFHKVDFSVFEQKKKKPGRPSKDPKKNKTTTVNKIDSNIHLDETAMDEWVRKECTFVLGSNDLSVTGERLLREYKTQYDVEKRFKKLKSPSFMNSLFLKTPKRLEALVYLLLIALMILTIAERKVRDGLKEENEVVHGIENRKQVRPTLDTILILMDRIRVATYISQGKAVRKVVDMDESTRKVLRYLEIPESCFAWNGDG